MTSGIPRALAGALLACALFGGPLFVSLPGAPRFRGAQVATGSAEARSQKMPGAARGACALAAPFGFLGLALLAGRRAFRSQRGNVVPANAFDASKQIGAVEPLGYWDPCGFMKDADESKFLEYRGKELKHGRIAMLAVVGFLVQPFADSIGFQGVPGGVQAMTTYPASVGLGCLFLVAGFFELRILPDIEKAPGNYGDPLKFEATGTGAYDDKWRNFEIQNGRLAMFGAIGTMVAGYATGLDAYQQWAGAKAASIAFIKTTLPFAP